MEKAGDKNQSFFAHGLFIALIILSLVVIVGEGSHITGHATLDSETAKTKIQAALSGSMFSRVMQASMCLVVNDPAGAASFSLEKTASGWTVNTATGYCKGLKAEDVVVQFPNYDSLAAILDSPSPRNIATAAASGDFQILESRYVERGGNVLCDATFKVKYCGALSAMVTSSELIDGDLVCCVDKLTKEDTALLEQHLQEGSYKDEIGILQEKPASTSAFSFSSPSLMLAGGAAGVLLIVVIVVVVMKRSKPVVKPSRAAPQMQAMPTQMQMPTEDPTVTELRGYVSQTLSQGYTAEDLRSHLLQIGWDQNTADKVITEEYQKLATAR